MESDNDDDAGYDDYVCSEHDNGDHMKRRKRNEFQSVSPLNVSRTKPISSTFLPSSHIILLIVTMLKLFIMFFYYYHHNRDVNIFGNYDHNYGGHGD